MRIIFPPHTDHQRRLLWLLLKLNVVSLEYPTSEARSYLTDPQYTTAAIHL